VVLVLVLGVWLGTAGVPIASFSVLADSCKCDGNPTAYIFIGDVGGGLFGVFNELAFRAAAIEAKEDFEKAGYDVRPINWDATRVDVKNALRDPCIRGLWIGAHSYAMDGKEENARAGVIMKCAPGGKCGEKGMDDVLTPGDINENQCVQELTLHSCYQRTFENDWKETFTNPNLRIHAWRSSTKGHYVYWAQKIMKYRPIGEGHSSTTSRTLALASYPVQDPYDLSFPVIHLTLGVFRTFKNPYGRTIFDTSPISNHRLSDELNQYWEELVGHFGTRRLEFWAVSDDLEDYALLGQMHVEDGKVGDQERNETLAPALVVDMTNSAMYSALENPEDHFGYYGTDGIYTWYKNGEGDYLELTGWEGETLAKVFMGLIFGINAIPLEEESVKEEGESAPPEIRDISLCSVEYHLRPLSSIHYGEKFVVRVDFSDPNGDLSHVGLGIIVDGEVEPGPYPYDSCEVTTYGKTKIICDFGVEGKMESCLIQDEHEARVCFSCEVSMG